MKLIYSDEFIFYTSTMYEICLHCHWLCYSSFILNFGQCASEHTSYELTLKLSNCLLIDQYRNNVRQPVYKEK